MKKLHFILKKNHTCLVLTIIFSLLNFSPSIFYLKKPNIKKVEYFIRVDYYLLKVSAVVMRLPKLCAGLQRKRALLSANE